MIRPLAGLAAAALIAGAASAYQNASAAPAASASPEPAAKPVTGAKPDAAKAAPGDTPMAQRVAVLGVLNKRNGIWHDVTLRPGHGVRIGEDLIVRLRACEKTADWEQQQLTGAFVQVDVRGVDRTWRRFFSGWLFKESPSLNVVEHPVYDVWPKSCAMTRPATGSETVAAGAPGATRSRAKKSTASDARAPAPSPNAPPADNASSSSPR